MGIDFETDGFFGSMASMRMDLEDYNRWCRTYESFNYPKWTMKDGNQIALGDMSDRHLANTIALVERKEPDNGWLVALKQEKTYRELKSKIKTLKSELAKMEEISNIVF